MSVQLEYQAYGVIYGRQQVWSRRRAVVGGNRKPVATVLYPIDLLDKPFDHDKYRLIRFLADQFLKEKESQGAH